MSEDLLGPLRNAGTPDSEGDFSIDQRHALEKLRTYQLAEPAAALLKLVQSAVAAGARKIRIDSHLDISVIHDGRAPTDDQLANLLVSVLTAPRSADERSLVGLAIGVNAAIGNGGEVEVECRRDEHLSRAIVSAAAVSVASETAHGFPSGWTTRITAHRLPLTLFARQRLFPLLRYAPVPVYCNGRLLNLEVYGASKTIPFWQPAEDALVLRRPGQFWSSYYEPSITWSRCAGCSRMKVARALPSPIRAAPPSASNGCGVSRSARRPPALTTRPIHAIVGAAYTTSSRATVGSRPIAERLP